VSVPWTLEVRKKVRMEVSIPSLPVSHFSFSLSSSFFLFFFSYFETGRKERREGGKEEGGKEKRKKGKRKGGRERKGIPTEWEAE
jgi:hypothetical protein